LEDVVSKDEVDKIIMKRLPSKDSIVDKDSLLHLFGVGNTAVDASISREVDSLDEQL
jgi:hypothetical protein